MSKKNRVLGTMLELVVKQGIHATPMSQVAKNAKVAIGTIYHYFESKEDILCEIYKLIRQDFATILIQDKRDKSDVEIFKTYWKKLYHYYISNPDTYIFYEHIAKPPIIPKSLMEETKDYYRDHADFFWEGVKNGTLKNIHVTLLVQIAYSTIVAAVDLFLKEEIPMNNDQIDAAANASWDAIRVIA